MLKKIVLSCLLLVVVLAILLFGSLYYLGFFSSPQISEQRLGPYLVVYEHFVGDYKLTGKIHQKVYDALVKEKIKPARGIGIYYDDPTKTPSSQQRSDCGSIIEEKDWRKFSKVRDKFKRKNIRRYNCLVAEFPLKNFLSYTLGAIKCYPALVKYAQEKGYKMSLPPMEIYDYSAMKIFYILIKEK